MLEAVIATHRHIFGVVVITQDPSKVLVMIRIIHNGSKVCVVRNIYQLVSLTGCISLIFAHSLFGVGD